MSILKKLSKTFAGKSGAESPTNRLQIQRAARVMVTPLHRISFRPVGSEANLLGLRNISIGGMALICDRVVKWASEDLIRGLLTVDKKEFQIEARIRHLSDVLAGCEFTGENLTLKRAIEDYLRVEILALNLRPIGQAYLKPDPRGKAQWLTDGKANELYCVSDDQGLVAFHMSFIGHYVEWTREAGVRAGSVRPNEDDRPYHKGAELLDLSKSLTRETISLAKVFVQNVERVADELRRELIEKLAD